jgi:hypothetical protein
MVKAKTTEPLSISSGLKYALRDIGESSQKSEGMIRKLVLGLGLLMDLVGVFMLWYIAPRIIHDDSGIYAPGISYTYFVVALTVVIMALVFLVAGITFPSVSKTGLEAESTGKKEQV